MNGAPRLFRVAHNLTSIVIVWPICGLDTRAHSHPRALHARRIQMHALTRLPIELVQLDCVRRTVAAPYVHRSQLEFRIGFSEIVGGGGGPQASNLDPRCASKIKAKFIG